MGIVNIKTGKEMTRREVIAGLGALSLAGSANATVRHGLGARLATVFGEKAISDWWTPLLTATWPNATAFEENESDTENYNDIYATYPMAS